MTKQPGAMVGQSIAESMKLDDAEELDRIYAALGIAGNMNPVDEIKRLRGERDKPLPAGRDQLAKILRFYASSPYADSSNETVRVRAVLLATAADEIDRLRTILLNHRLHGCEIAGLVDGQ